MANAPATTKKNEESHMYITPISLWSVVRSHLRIPVLALGSIFAPACAAWAPAMVPASIVLSSLLLLLEPARELFRGDHVHGNEHLPVEDPAELRALPLVRPRLLDLEPRVIHAAGIGVHLHAELGHEPAVDHVDRRDVHGHDLPVRHDERLV